jgi:hypothetical protein
MPTLPSITTVVSRGQARESRCLYPQAVAECQSALILSGARADHILRVRRTLPLRGLGPSTWQQASVTARSPSCARGRPSGSGGAESPTPAADPLGRAEQSPPRPRPTLWVWRGGDSPLGLPASCSRCVASGCGFHAFMGSFPIEWRLCGTP